MLPLWGVAGAKQTRGIEPIKDEWLVENDMTLLEDKNSVCSGFSFSAARRMDPLYQRGR